MARWVEVNGVQFINEVVRTFVGCFLRFVRGLLLASRRSNRTYGVVKGVGYVVPKIPLVRAKAQDGVNSFRQVR